MADNSHARCARVIAGVRRRSLHALLLGAVACGGSAGEDPADGAMPVAGTEVAARTITLTFDDLPAISTSRDIARQQEITDGILATLQAAGVPAIGFVNEDKLVEGDRVDSARIALLQQWLEAGQQLGNHSYSHPDLHTTPPAAFHEDVLRGEAVTRELLRERGDQPRWFRHPFLHTGRDLEVKRALEAFLAEHGYSVAPVTIDNYDYVFARAYDRALDAADTTVADSIARIYIAYMDTVTGFYEAQARAIVGYELPQILLLHANRLNAHHLDDLIAMLERRGYGFITIDEALEDAAYDTPDEYVGPAGITWLHRWALTAGMRGDVFAGEPEVPAWIAARADSR